MGSTDDQGNRLSNMPGEERPSINSVTPYDDNAETLANKVQQIVDQSKAEKLKKAKKQPSKEPQ